MHADRAVRSVCSRELTRWNMLTPVLGGHELLDTPRTEVLAGHQLARLLVQLARAGASMHRRLEPDADSALCPAGAAGQAARRSRAVAPAGQAAAAAGARGHRRDRRGD